MDNETLQRLPGDKLQQFVVRFVGAEMENIDFKALEFSAAGKQVFGQVVRQFIWHHRHRTALIRLSNISLLVEMICEAEE